MSCRLYFILLNDIGQFFKFYSDLVYCIIINSSFLKLSSFLLKIFVTF
jgi:hypothetical protein